MRCMFLLIVATLPSCHVMSSDLLAMDTFHVSHLIAYNKVVINFWIILLSNKTVVFSQSAVARVVMTMAILPILYRRTTA